MVSPKSVFGGLKIGATAESALLASNALRKMARDESLKARIENDPVLFGLAKRAAGRYIGGSTLAECIHTIKAVNANGHAATADYMGESTREESKAASETTHFLELIEAINSLALNCTISLDLSHIGLAIDPALGVENATKVARAARAIGREVIISMEGSERTDATLAAHAKLCEQFDHVGITLQARMLRTEQDLQTVLKRPGKIRLVKGAYDEPETLAHPRISDGLNSAYQRYAELLLASGHACSIGTHDAVQLQSAHEFIEQKQLGAHPFEFEVLYGLGPEQSDYMRALGYPTRQYIVYGSEWYLYVCHRIAEEPTRLFQAMVDVVKEQ